MSNPEESTAFHSVIQDTSNGQVKVRVLDPNADPSDSYCRLKDVKMVLDITPDTFIDADRTVLRINQDNTPDHLYSMICNMASTIFEKLRPGDKSTIVLDPRLVLLDSSARVRLGNLANDVRAWMVPVVPIEYSSSEVNFGFHSIEVRPALDIEGRVLGVKTDDEDKPMAEQLLARVYIYAQSVNHSEMKLLMRRPDEKTEAAPETAPEQSSRTLEDL